VTALLLAAALLLALTVIAVLLRGLLTAQRQLRDMATAVADHDCPPRPLAVTAHVARHVRSAVQPQPKTRLRDPLYLPPRRLR
jgi:hypothetical protein